MIQRLLLICFLLLPASTIANDVQRFIEEMNREDAASGRYDNPLPAGEKAIEQGNVDPAHVKQIEDYLNNIRSMISTFVQIAPDGGLSNGTFYLKRPGRLRWEYNPPVPVVITAKGGLLTYLDTELNQISHISLASTPLGFLIHKKIQFGDKIQVANTEQTADFLRITLKHNSDEIEGTIKLEFSTTPMLLKKMEVSDPKGGMTSVSFLTHVFDRPIENKLFLLKKAKK